MMSGGDIALIEEQLEALRAENARLQSRIDDLSAINATLDTRTATLNALRAEKKRLENTIVELVDETKENIVFIRKQADEIARLREALKPFAVDDFLTLTVADLRAARAAMGETDE